MVCKKPLRVAMIGQKTILSHIGGVETVVGELSERMTKNGLIVTCYNRRGAKEDRPKEYRGIKMKYAWTIKAKGLAALTSSFFATIAVLLSKNDIVHYHAEGSCAWIWLLRLFSKKRIIVTIHGLDWQRAKWGKIASRYIKHGEKMAAKYADEVIVLSSRVKKYFKEVYDRETVYIPNGVNIPTEKEAKIIKEKYSLSKDGYILFLGRIVPEKGLHYLIDAYDNIATDKKLVIAGAASDTEEYYASILEKTKNNKKIVFTGFVQGEEQAELYSNAYIYCLPSDLEGMPLTLLEAMSYGNCCLTSDISECAEVVAGHGYTFKKSSISSLASALKKICSSNDAVKGYKDDARKYVLGSYNWDNVVRETVQLYIGEGKVIC